MPIRTYNFADITGATHKELGVGEIVDDAVSQELEGIVVISSGNFSYAIQEEIEHRNLGLKLFNLVSGSPRSNLEVEIPNSDILRTNEERVDVVRNAIGRDLRLQDYTDFVPQAYGHSVGEILSGEPNYVICPVGSGKLWLSIVRQVQELDLTTSVIGVTPRGKNGFFLDNLVGNLDSVADKLTAPYTHLRDEVLDQAPTHIVAEVSERQLKKAYREARSQGVDCEPSGAAGLVCYDSRFKSKYGIDSKDDVVIVSTGKGFRHEITEAKVRECRRRTGIGAVTSMFLAGALYLVSQTIGHIGDHQMAIQLMGSMNTPTDQRALEYMAEREGVSSIMNLSADAVSMAGTISVMDSDGLEYVHGMRNPRKAETYEEFAKREVYQDFAFRCPNFGRSDFKYCKPYHVGPRRGIW
jgi:hypothetical protein